MLDDRLTAEERRALLLLLTRMALTDGKLAESEVRFIRRLALPMGVEVGDLLATLDSTELGELCAQLARPVAARIALLQLLRLAHVDDLYARAERQSIEEIAHLLGVPRSRFVQLEDLARRERELLVLAERLIEKND